MCHSGKSGAEHVIMAHVFFFFGSNRGINIKCINLVAYLGIVEVPHILDIVQSCIYILHYTHKHKLNNLYESTFSNFVH